MEQRQMKVARVFVIVSISTVLASCGPTGDNSAPEGNGTLEPEQPIVAQAAEDGEEVTPQPSVPPKPKTPVERPVPATETPPTAEIDSQAPSPAVADLQPQTETAEPPAETTDASAETISPHQKQLDESLRAWSDLKAKCGGNYSYKIRWSSWVGFGHETEIVARDNKVTERRYREWSGQPVPVEPGKPSQDRGKSWTETGDDLGSHKKGAPPKTLDELYVEAQGILNKKLEPHQRLYVRFDKQGLLSSCFYVDTRIADDAPQTGVVISSIELEKTDP
jgi:type IV secretory pathway VirB10-like protein